MGCKIKIYWWKVNSKTYPNPARMARDYLAIPGTSASSERLFSSGKLTISETRNSLSGTTIQACQCLKSWYKSTPNLWKMDLDLSQICTNNKKVGFGFGFFGVGFGFGGSDLGLLRRPCRNNTGISIAASCGYPEGTDLQKTILPGQCRKSWPSKRRARGGLLVPESLSL